jgi:ABC-type Zn uptake system ZnuABC Zn-binding protein ZnuA
MNCWEMLISNSARHQLAQNPAGRTEADIAGRQSPLTYPDTPSGGVRMVKKTGSGAIAWVILIAMALAACPVSGVDVVCTTFPMYQITRNVTQGREGVTVALLLPPSLGCPHHYSLTPQDMQKIARADVLVVNGLGMEEFLGAPVKKANPQLRVVDSSAGIGGVLQYVGGEAHGHEPSEAPFEWGGIFDLAPGTYRWTFARKDGKYADPAMKMVILPAAGKDAAAIDRLKPAAEKAFEGDVAHRESGAELTPGGQAYTLMFDDGKDVTAFTVRIEKAGPYGFFTEHMPTEFEAGEHFFKDAEGRDVEAVAQEPEGEHGDEDAEPHGDDHGAESGHHHQHPGANPHLFASPRIQAVLVENIAAGLSKADPEGAGVYFNNAQAYAMRMNALADEMTALVKTLKNNRIVQPHGVFDYLARDIGLEIVAVTQPHGQEPSAAEMLKLTAMVKAKKAGAVFTEPQYSPKVGQTIAKETGIPTAVLDPAASGPADALLDYYEQVMRKNMETLQATLEVNE